MYRYHTLPGARAKAARMGWRGALYAWESADTGEETTPEQVVGPDGQVVEVLCGTQEQHISADIAYAVWQYWQATGDERSCSMPGPKSCWRRPGSGRAAPQPEADGRYHIRGVIGPDEYHEHIDDNAYTNVMARWNIRRGTRYRGAAARALARALGRLSRTGSGLMTRSWSSGAMSRDTLVDRLRSENRAVRAVRGLFRSGGHRPGASTRAGPCPMDVVLGRERTQRSQVVKQADVVALLALLPEAFDRRGAARQFPLLRAALRPRQLAEPRPCTRSSRPGWARPRWRCAISGETAATDLADTTGGSAGGVHIAALGGLWQAAVFGFAGLSLHGDGMALDPHLPTAWRAFSFRVHWRGRQVKVHIEHGRRLAATLEAGEPMTLAVSGERYTLRPGGTLRMPFRRRSL